LQQAAMAVAASALSSSAPLSASQPQDCFNQPWLSALKSQDRETLSRRAESPLANPVA
jgi:hypothetical protein